MTGSERPSPEPLLKKEASPAVLGGGNSGNALEPSNALNYSVWGIPAVLSRGIPGNALRAFPGSFRNFSGICSGRSQPYWGYGPLTGSVALRGFVDSEALKRRGESANSPPLDLIQDTFDHDKGQKSAISGRRLHWISQIFSSRCFPFFSRFSVQFSKEIAKNVEKIARFPDREKSAESCHLSGCHGFSVPPPSPFPSPGVWGPFPPLGSGVRFPPWRLGSLSPPPPLGSGVRFPPWGLGSLSPPWGLGSLFPPGVWGPFPRRGRKGKGRCLPMFIYSI